MSSTNVLKLRGRPRRRLSIPGAAGCARTPAPAPEALLSILDAMLARIAYLDRRRRFRYVNPAYADAVGLAPREIVGRSVAQVRGLAHSRRMAPHARAALAGETIRWEGWHDDPQLGRAYYDTVYAPMRIAGAVVGYLVLVRDLTRLKRREEELVARTAQLEAILAGIADGVTIADAQERLVMCNKGFVSMFDLPAELVQPGVPREAFVRHRLSQGVLYPGERDALLPARMVAERTARVRAAGGVLLEDIEVNGRHLHVRRCDLPDGTSVSTFSDFTARIEAEQARQRQHDAAREAQQMGTVAALLAGIAHELRNPLSLIAAHATMLEEDVAGTPLAGRAEAVQAAVRQCDRIVASLLASVHRRVLRRERVDVRDALTAALDLVNHQLRGSGIQVTTEVPANLPFLHADPDQVVHLLANLLGNAAAALRARPGSPRVQVTARAEGGTLTVSVADNGPGIPLALRERVFHPFFTTKPDGAGTGVGLALCRTIAQEHGGSIAAEETPGGGATLMVTLPLPRETCP